ncbi:MAG TPA: hypothetical protein HA341_03310 [Halobacteria archaeon]|nr:hypothetical protein [Halobacteria archaeon]HIH77940.1 hypothetical protein [Halobacteria archaeon]
MNDFVKIEIGSQVTASQIYENSIQNELKKPKFSMYAVMDIDEAVDLGILDKEYYLESRNVAEREWVGEDARSDSIRQSKLVEQVRYLRELYDEGHKMAYPLYERWLQCLSLGYEDASRRWRILPKNELDRINSCLGENLVSQTLYMGFPEIGRENLDVIARSWGPSAKLVDNICDLWSDIRGGYINLPKEDIENIRGLEVQGNMVRGVNPVELAIDRSYLISMIKEAEKEFKRSENLFMKIKHDIKINEERLSLFKNFFNTFILEARKKYNL